MAEGTRMKISEEQWRRRDAKISELNESLQKQMGEIGQINSKLSDHDKRFDKLESKMDSIIKMLSSFKTLTEEEVIFPKKTPLLPTPDSSLKTWGETEELKVAIEVTIEETMEVEKHEHECVDINHQEVEGQVFDQSSHWMVDDLKKWNEENSVTQLKGQQDFIICSPEDSWDLKDHLVRNVEKSDNVGSILVKETGNCEVNLEKFGNGLGGIGEHVLQRIHGELGVVILEEDQKIDKAWDEEITKFKGGTLCDQYGDWRRILVHTTSMLTKIHYTVGMIFAKGQIQKSTIGCCFQLWYVLFQHFDMLRDSLISTAKKLLALLCLDEIEEAKNLILAGVKSVTLHDVGSVELWDLSGNFNFSKEDIGKNRALASVQKLQGLNNAVMISPLTIELTKEQCSHDGLDDARLQEMDQKLLRNFAFGARSVLNSMAAMFGGIIGQEVVKACSGKFHHHQQGEGTKKHLVLLLNKINLVPREAVEKWLKYLREELPTVAFKCSTQEQKSILGWKSSQKAGKTGSQLQTSDCLGAETLIKLLKNYSRSHEIKKSITVGLISLPNVGKSSLCNRLKRSLVVNVGATPGLTRFVQEVQLDKNVKVLDCPGVVMLRSAGGNDASIALRNCKRIEKLDDPVDPVTKILKLCPARLLVSLYKVPSFDSVDDFLQKVATVKGKLKKDGIVDVDAAARIVLHDWNEGKIPYYTMPPTRSDGEHSEAKIVSKFGKEFNADEIYGNESSFSVAGLLKLLAGSYLLVITERECVGYYLGHPVFKVTSLKVFPCDHSLKNTPVEQKKMKTEFSEMLSVAERTSGLYFSYDVNITLSAQRLNDLGDESKLLPLWRQADPRFLWNNYMREVLIENGYTVSFVQVRGSIPLLWDQIVDLTYEPNFDIVRPEEASWEDQATTNSFSLEDKTILEEEDNCQQPKA